MMLHKIFLLFSSIILIVTAQCSGQVSPIRIVPQPKTVQLKNNQPPFEIGRKLTIHLPEKTDKLFHRHFEAFGKILFQQKDCTIEFVKDREDSDLYFQLDADLAPEEYSISVEANRITIAASTIKGCAHATASLIQIVGQMPNGQILALDIRDQPDCGYRSLMMDLGRNPHSIECLKETIDLLWFYKLDSLHLHLTDDQRFAFPSKAFPKLQSKSKQIAWDEYAALERYAQARGIYIVPELDVPGHSTILRRVYPEVFGKNSTELAQSMNSRKAIKILLDEMVELFPSSPYVHVGGDEAGGVPEDLQRDLINELHAHLKSRGKRTIVWEGPRLGTGDNKVDPEVIHINWRTINFPAEQMLKAGYPVVNASWDPMYVVDHYPRNNFTMASPEYIFSNMNLYRFAHFNPGIPTFSKPIVVDPADYKASIIGFCMAWWEGREINFFPLVTPRLVSMAEGAWNAKTAGSKTQRERKDFLRRSAQSESTRATAFYPISILADPIALEQESVFHERTTIDLKSKVKGEIRYTLDSSTPNLNSPGFVTPFPIEQTTTVRAALFRNEIQVGHGSRRKLTHVEPVKNLALGKSVTSSVTAGPLHSPARLTDGGTGKLDYYLAYPTEPTPVEITIDLDESVMADQVVVHAFTDGRAFESYEVQISEDGKTFTRIANRYTKPAKVLSREVHDFKPTRIRYVRVLTRGCKNFVFESFSKITEIQVFSHEE